MTAVPILQVLSWGEESPLLRSGEVDIDVLARGLARAEFPAGRRPQPYTHAQHALVVSEAVDTLARLRLTERRVLAVHAWLAQIRNSELKDRQSAGSGKKNLALRTMDIEALADVLARTNRWNDPQSRSGGVAPGAVAFDECLKSLCGLDAHERRRLSLYALLAETVFAGLGTAVAEAALEAAGLAREVPEIWVRILRLVRRMAEAAVRRDLPGMGWDEQESLAGHREKDRADGAGRGRAALACALPGTDHHTGRLDMSEHEQTRTLRWPGDPAALTVEGVDFEAVAHVLANTCCWRAVEAAGSIRWRSTP